MAAVIKNIPSQSASSDFGDQDVTNVGSIALDEITSDAGGAVTVTLGTDAGDDFIVGPSNKLVVEGDTDNIGMGTATPRRAVDVLDSSNPQLRLSHTDDTEYLEFQSLSTGDAVMKMTDSICYVRSGDAITYLQLQNTTSGFAEDVEVGLTVGLSGNAAYIYNRETAGASNPTLYLGVGNTAAVVINGNKDIQVNGNATIGDNAADAHSVMGTLAVPNGLAYTPTVITQGTGTLSGLTAADSSKTILLNAASAIVELPNLTADDIGTQIVVCNVHTADLTGAVTVATSAQFFNADNTTGYNAAQDLAKMQTKTFILFAASSWLIVG